MDGLKKPGVLWKSKVVLPSRSGYGGNGADDGYRCRCGGRGTCITEMLNGTGAADGGCEGAGAAGGRTVAMAIMRGLVVMITVALLMMVLTVMVVKMKMLMVMAMAAIMRIAMLIVAITVTDGCDVDEDGGDGGDDVDENVDNDDYRMMMRTMTRR